MFRDARQSPAQWQRRQRQGRAEKEGARDPGSDEAKLCESQREECSKALQLVDLEVEPFGKEQEQYAKLTKALVGLREGDEAETMWPDQPTHHEEPEDRHNIGSLA